MTLTEVHVKRVVTAMDRLIPDISSELKMKGPVLHGEYESLSFVLQCERN